MINRDNEIKIPEAWMTMIKKHNSRRAMRQLTTKGGKQIRKIKNLKADVSSVRTSSEPLEDLRVV